MALTDRELDSIVHLGDVRVLHLAESYKRQRNELNELKNRIEILEDALLGTNVRNTELDLQRRLAQSRLSKLQNQYDELNYRMKGLEK